MTRLPAFACATLLAGACVAAPPPPTSVTGAASCRTAGVTVAFDFEGASGSKCVIEGERAIAILVSPEHAPPINPSAWYAFRYEAVPGAPVAITLRYLDGRHRYVPKWQAGGEVRRLEAEVAEDGRSARFTLPTGMGVVAGQELYTAARYADLLARLAASPNARRVELGRSHDGRAIAAVELGRADAPHVVVLLGRQHPPEVTGALAMEAFLDRLPALVDNGAIDSARVRFLIVPLMNPDGVARGHWRANLGGTDLNRDWGSFAQPESRAVKTWLDNLPKASRPVALIDFHSTGRDTFYTIPADLPTTPTGFTEAWLAGIAARAPRFAIRQSPGHESGSGVSKNWFYETYGVPAITFELGDETDRALIAVVGAAAAEALADALGCARGEACALD